MLALAAPALGMQLRTTGPEDLPRSVPQLRTYDRIVAAFPQEGTTHEIVVWSDQPLDRAAVAAAHAPARDLRGGRPAAVHRRRTPRWCTHRTARSRTSTSPWTYTQSDPRAREGLACAAHVLAAAGVLPRLPDVRRGCHRADRRGRRLLLGVQGAPAARHGVRAAAHLPGAGAGVPFGGDRGYGHRAQPALRRRGVRPAGAGVPAHLGRGAAGVPLQRCRDLVAPAVPLRRPLRAVDGLPRVRGVAGSARPSCGGCPTKDAVADGVTRSAGVVTSAAIVMVGVFGDLRHACRCWTSSSWASAWRRRSCSTPPSSGRCSCPRRWRVLGRWNWWLPRSWERLPHLEGDVQVAPVPAPPVPALGDHAHVVEPDQEAATVG